MYGSGSHSYVAILYLCGSTTHSMGVIYGCPNSGSLGREPRCWEGAPTLTNMLIKSTKSLTIREVSIYALRMYLKIILKETVLLSNQNIFVKRGEINLIRNKTLSLKNLRNILNPSNLKNNPNPIVPVPDITETVRTMRKR